MPAMRGWSGAGIRARKGIVASVGGRVGSVVVERPDVVGVGILDRLGVYVGGFWLSEGLTFDFEDYFRGDMEYEL